MTIEKSFDVTIRDKKTNQLTKQKATGKGRNEKEQWDEMINRLVFTLPEGDYRITDDSKQSS